MRYGTVVKFFEDKGFGFIRPDVGQDIFFHVSSLGITGDVPKINAGRAVKFELEPKKRTPPDEERDPNAKPPQRRAKVVELLNKMPGGELTNDGGLQPSRHPKARRKKASWKE